MKFKAFFLLLSVSLTACDTLEEKEFTFDGYNTARRPPIEFVIQSNDRSGPITTSLLFTAKALVASCNQDATSYCEDEVNVRVVAVDYANKTLLAGPVNCRISTQQVNTLEYRESFGRPEVNCNFW